MNSIGIEFRDVSRHYTQTGAVLEKISFQIPPGQLISLLGPSGCGKSTILRLMADLEAADAGRIEVAGDTLDRAFVFQESHLLPWRTALENVKLPLEIKRPKLPPSEITDRARRSLDNLGLGDALAKYPAQLSGGMKMRVSVARALVSEPRLLLLDEPFSALDDLTRHHLQEDLRALWRKRGMTVVFVTHSVAEAVYLSDRILVLSPRPARILRDFQVALGIDRSAETRLAPAYLQMVSEVASAYTLREPK